jgi:ATP-dependent DNA ligase
MPAGGAYPGGRPLDVRTQVGWLSDRSREKRWQGHPLFARGTDLSNRFEYVASALASLPDETVIDGELVALDEQGKPNFNLLQNSRSAESRIMFYAFDVLVRRGEDLMKQPLSKGREILATTVKPHDHVGISQVFNQTAKEMLAFVKGHGLEGIIAKRTDSMYEPGRRSGLWVKHRINLSQEFVIGGYIPSHLGVDSIVIGVYRGKDLHHAARVRAGFVPLTRRQVSNGSNLWKP